MNRRRRSTSQPAKENAVAAPEGDAPSPIEPVIGTPTLEAANTFVPKDNILRIDISEYAGYGGLIVANGGLEPNADSFFAKEYGFKVAISMSESETWSPLNNGRLAATATTADALAVLGRQFDAVVPIQLGYSRGADMVVVDRGIASVNALAGKILAASQFNESEFFIRYLAQEAGLPVVVLRDLDAKPKAGSLGLVFYEDAFVACDAYQHELAGGRPPERLRRLDAENRRSHRSQQGRRQGAGLEPQPAGHRRRAGGEQGIRQGPSGNGEGPRARHSRRQPPPARQPGGEHRRRRQGFQVDRGGSARRARARASVERAGEPRVLRRHHRLRRFLRRHLPVFGAGVRQPASAIRPIRRASRTRATSMRIAKRSPFSEQKIAIAPIRTSSQAALEGDPLLSKDIRFFFEPNSSNLDRSAAQNQEYLQTIKRFLQVSPGSTVLLRGHVDNARVNEFRQSGGEQLVQSMALKAMELSRQRAHGGP